MCCSGVRDDIRYPSGRPLFAKFGAVQEIRYPTLRSLTNDRTPAIGPSGERKWMERERK